MGNINIYARKPEKEEPFLQDQPDNDIISIGVMQLIQLYEVDSDTALEICDDISTCLLRAKETLED